jgi:hypothetical protein
MLFDRPKPTVGCSARERRGRGRGRNISEFSGNLYLPLSSAGGGGGQYFTPKHQYIFTRLYDGTPKKTAFCISAAVRSSVSKDLLTKESVYV